MKYNDGSKRRLPSFMTTKVTTPTRSSSSSSSSLSMPISPYQPVPSTPSSSSSSSSSSSKKMTRRSSLVCWLMVLFVCALILAAQLGVYNVFELYYSDEAILSEEAKAMKTEPFRVAQSKDNVVNAAFAIISTGSEGNTMKCSAAIETLVRHAGWGGKIYLIHDNPACYDLDTLLYRSGMERGMLELVYFNNSYTHSMRGTSGHSYVDPIINNIGDMVRIPNDMLEWIIKANIFHVITNPVIDIVVSIDCDTLFAQPGCAGELMGSLVNWQEDDPAIKATTISENAQGEITHVSLGTFAVHRKYSKDALFIWNKYITMKQPNFVRAMKDHALKVPTGQKNHMTVGHLVRLGSIDPQTQKPLHPPTSWEKMDIYHELSCINHVSRSTCDAFGASNVQAFIVRHNLESYNENVNYCHHWLLNIWLEQSWFPFHALFPWCPKLG